MKALRRLAAILPRFVSFARAIPFIACAPLVRSRGSMGASIRGPGIFFRLPFPVLRHGACEILPGSWMSLPAFAMLSDPGRAGVPCQTVHRYCSRCSENESLGIYDLSGLYHTAFADAVYASCQGRPLATQDSLLAAGRLCQAGLVSRWVMTEGFEMLFHSIPLLQASPGATEVFRLNRQELSYSSQDP